MAYVASLAFPGTRIVSQPWGPTDLSLEPWWDAAGCYWHCGIDIPMDTGTPVYALRPGKVIYRVAGLFGIQIGPALVDWYVHFSSAVVGWGQPVARGQLIGYAGNTVPSGGASFGPHLHFEVQLGNPRGLTGLNDPATSCDPVPVLVSAFPFTGDRTAMATLDDIYSLLKDVNAITLKRLEDKVDAMNAVTLGRLEAEVLKIPTSSSAGGTVDLSGALSAIADVKAAVGAVGADVSAIKAKTDRDLA